MSDLGLKHLVKTNTKIKLFKNHIYDVVMTYKELYSTHGCSKMAKNHKYKNKIQNHSHKNKG